MSLSNYSMNKTQSQNQQNKQSDKQHKTQDSLIVQINNEEVNIIHEDLESNKNSINMNYENLNFHVTR